MRSFGKFLIFQGALLIVTLFVIEVISYYLLPNSIAWRFHDYRRQMELVADNNGYPSGYYMPHATRGHDIAPGRTGTFSFGDSQMPIWSNRFGCFDRDWETFTANYYYFAGDSFTWGYNQFEENFPTLFEKETGIPSLKCGVVVSGTRHQFEKFKEIVGSIGHYPKKVIVSYYSNDISDDYFHPHKTVIDGFLVEHTFLDKDLKPVRADQDWLKAKLKESLRERQPQVACNASVREWLKCHSLIANIYTAAKSRMEGGMNGGGPLSVYIDYKGQPLSHMLTIESLHATPACHDCNDVDGKLGAPNLKAIADWKAHADLNNYELVFMMIPPRYAHGYREHYAGRAKKIADMGIDVLDLSQEFYAAGASVTDVYWRYDGHFSPKGARLAADALIRRWGQH